MSQLELLPGSEKPADLAAFFATLDRCKDKGRSTHGLHPYPAKFIPHIPRELIRAYSQIGDRVWDPMCGSGTTLVEAALEGREAFGTDINPIAALVSRAKTTALGSEDVDEITDLIHELEAAARAWQCAPTRGVEVEPPDFHNRDHWFQPQATRELAFSLTLLDRLSSSASADLARCAFSAIIVGVSNQESETRWRAKPQEIVPGGVLAKLAAKLRGALAAVQEFAVTATGSAEVVCGDARGRHLPEEAVDLVVTSPPYANSHDYYLYNKLRLFWLGYPVAPVQAAEIGSRNRHSDQREGIETYLDALSEIFAEVARVVRPGGVAAFVVADAVIRGEFFSMDELLPELASQTGMEFTESFAFDHRRFNKAFQRGFGTRCEKATHVLVFRRA